MCTSRTNSSSMNAKCLKITDEYISLEGDFLQYNINSPRCIYSNAVVSVIVINGCKRYFALD